MHSLLLLSLVIATFVLPLRLADKGVRAVLSAFAIVVAFYAVYIRIFA
jgi:hypothetical protein